MLLFSPFSSVSELKPGDDTACSDPILTNSPGQVWPECGSGSVWAGPVHTDEGWPGIQIEDLDVNEDIDAYKFTVRTLDIRGSALAVAFLFVRKGAA